MSHLTKAMANARPADVIVAELNAAERIAQARARGMLVLPYKIGEVVPGKGVFAGQWQPWVNNKKLDTLYLLYAAPVDLGDKNGKTEKAFAFNEAARQITTLKGWHGHEGSRYVEAAALYQALKTGTYDGGWFIPPLELLLGRDSRGRVVHRHSLYHRKNKPGFAFAITKDADGALNHYWSSTIDPSTHKVWAVNFANKRKALHGRATKLNCRPMRAEMEKSTPLTMNLNL